MSLKTRLGLLAGSSFAAAMLASSPTLAANECGNPGTNGAAADSFTCATPPTYGTGVDYSTTSNGDLTVTLRNRFDTGTTGTGGIRMFGKTGEDMTLLREDNPAGSGDPRIVNTAGRGIDVSTLGDGNAVINFTDGDPTSGESNNINTGTAPIRITGSSDAIRARAQGTGNVTVTFAPTGTPSGITNPRAAITAGADVGSGGSGILARTTTGAISIDTRGASFAINATNGGSAIDALSTSGNVSIMTGLTAGRLYGILAETGGAGALNITVDGNVSANATSGVAAISTIAGTGATTIAINSGTISGGAGLLIRAVSGSTVTVTNGDFAVLAGRFDFSGVTGGVTYNGGRLTASGASVFSGAADTLVPLFGSLAAGASISMGGGADTFGHTSSFTMGAGMVDFGAGADIYNLTDQLNANGATLNFGADADTLNLSGMFIGAGNTLDFGTGADTFNQSGDMFWGGGTISNLEAFNNSGTIYLGGQPTLGVNITDGLPNDALILPTAVFNASGDSRIALDANLGNHAAQIGCVTATVADCISIAGSAGSTMLTVQDASFSVDGGTLGAVVTLVQGSSAAEHFTLDPNSSFYLETADGGIIRKPLVAYRFEYDDANQRHVLIGTPTDEPFQVGTFAAAAQETWRATTGSWLTRQADLRATPGGFADSAGVWARIGAQTGEREAAASFEQGGLTFDYDLTQKQKIAHLVFGADMVLADSADSIAVLGAMGGFVRSDVEFEATPTEAVTSGFMGGVYSSYIRGPLFIDGVLSVNALHVKADAPAMNLGLDVPMTFDLVSLGGQVEAGWRIGMGSIFVEPLVGASYVSTKVDDTEVPGGSGEFAFENSKSFRIGGGGRIGMDSELMGMASSLSLTGRYWNELEGENSATITTASGSSALLADDFAGSFSEVVASVNLYSGDGGVSGFANLGGKFADGYQAVDGSVGVRVRW